MPESTDTSAENTEQETVVDGRKNAVDATISVGQLDSYLNDIHAVVEEARLHFDTDGVHCYAVDLANVAYVESHLDELHFDDFDAVDCVIGAKIRKLRTVLELLDGDVEMGVNVAEETIEFDDGDAHYETAYIDPDSIREADHDYHDWTITTEVYVGGHALDRAVSLASEVGDHIELDYDAETQTLSATADEDEVSSSVEMSPESMPQDNDGWGYYTESYLCDFMDAIPPGSGVGVGLGDNVPLELSIAHAGIETTYALAPRIQRSDD